MTKDVQIDGKRLDQLRALASDVRFRILVLLKERSIHFPDQVTGDPDEMGVCVSLLARKLDISQPTASRHLDIMKRSGLVTVNRYQSWSYYQRDDAELRAFQDWFANI